MTIATRPRNLPSDSDIFLATNEPSAVKDTSIFVSADTADPALDLSPVEMEHTRAGTLRMWRLTATGSVPIYISKNSLRDAIRGGMSPHCHDCQGDHGEGRNECPGRKKVMFRYCPKPGCGKRFYDPEPTGLAIKPVPEEDDELTISNDDLSESTPATRTRMLVQRHVETYHKDDLLVYFPDAQRVAEAVR